MNCQDIQNVLNELKVNSKGAIRGKSKVVDKIRSMHLKKIDSDLMDIRVFVAKVANDSSQNPFSRIDDFINNELWIDGVCNCFKNGKFADVVQNFDCEDGYCTKQCDKCKDSFEVVKECENRLYKCGKTDCNYPKCQPNQDDKSSDKELLKECLGLLTTVYENIHSTPYIKNESKVLITKLNKHLNHE